jgi:DNA-binding transcriptional ArsR family regulator
LNENSPIRAPIGHSTSALVGASDEQLDRLFHALSDTTRRDILRRSIRGESSVSQLAGAYPMSFAAVQKHIAILERVGLVSKVRRGRELLVQTEIDSLETAKLALDQLEMTWRGRTERMSALLALETAAKGSGQPKGGEG